MLTSPTPRIRANNFDLIRLGLATIVAIVHVSVLSLEPGLAWVPRVLSSALAVKAFFVVSGFLIVMSYERSSSVRSYADKRARRLYPAYAVVTILSALFLFFASSVPAVTYFSAEWWRFLASNALFLNFIQPNLPGVFVDNPVTNVNGALWTLKIEVMFYALVPLLVALCRRWGWAPVLLTTYAASVIYLSALQMLATTGNSELFEAFGRQLPGQLSYFTTGAALFYGFSIFESRKRLFVSSAAAVLAIDQAYSLTPFEPAALAIVVIAIAFAGNTKSFVKYGDYSYGIYILHFPIIQLFVHAAWFRGSPALLLVTSLATALAGAFLMWHLVEKRWLLSSSHYKHGG